jgi:hypothetical protein
MAVGSERIKAVASWGFLGSGGTTVVYSAVGGEFEVTIETEDVEVSVLTEDVEVSVLTEDVEV